MRDFLNQYFGVFLGGIIVATLVLSYFYMEKATYLGPDPIRLTNEAQVILKKKNQQLLKACQAKYSSQEDQKKCYITMYEKYYGYDGDFECFDIYQVVDNIKRKERMMGFFFGVLIPSILFLILWIIWGTKDNFNRIFSQCARKFENSVDVASKKINELYWSACSTNSSIRELKDTIEDKQDDFLSKIRNGEVAVNAILSDIQQRIFFILEHIKDESKEQFKSAVEESKDNIIRSNKEITQETENAIQRLQTLLQEAEKAIAVFVAIANKKRTAEEKRKFHGKAKTEKLMEQTRMELIEEGKRNIRDNEGK